MNVRWNNRGITNRSYFGGEERNWVKSEIKRKVMINCFVKTPNKFILGECTRNMVKSNEFAKSVKIQKHFVKSVR